MTLSPLDLELHFTCHRERLLAEVAAERLARQAAGPRRPGVRTRLAGVLYALALRLDHEAAAAGVDRRMATAGPC